MDEGRVLALVSDLSSPDENIRLKAANAFVNAEGEAARRAVSKLREVYHGDANPAVKFLAKKALKNLGEPVESSQKSSEVLPAARRAETYHVLGDGRALWRTAQEVLKDEILQLVGLLRSTDEVIQDRLTHAIERLGPSAVAGPLIKSYLQSESFQVSKGEIDTPDGRPLRSDEIDHAVHAARLRSSKVDPAMAAAMGNLKVPEVFSVLCDMLLAPERVFARGAFSILSSSDEADVIPPLLEVLGAGDETLDPLVHRRLLELSQAPAARDAIRDVLVDRLGRRGPIRPRVCAARLLGELADAGGLDVLREALGDDAPAVRAEAVWAFCHFDFPASWLVSNIRPVLRDTAPLPAATAAVALLGGDGQAYAEAAIQSIMAGPPAGRVALGKALARASHAAAGPPLERLLRDVDADVREEAVRASREVQQVEVVEFLGQLLADGDEPVAVAAIEAVGRLGLEQFNDLLLLLIDQTETPRARATILACLGRMGFVENVPTIAFFLNAEDARVRANALEALECINDPKSTSLVHLSLSDPSPRVVANAVIALWSWGELTVARTKLGELLRGTPAQRAAGCHAVGDIFAHSRTEAALVDRPLLVAALRQAPRYAEFRHMLQT